MGQQKGNPIPSYQNQAYETLRPNTNARENRNFGTKPVMIDDNTTLNDVVDVSFATDAILTSVSSSIDSYIATKANTSDVATSLALKANLASPALTGTPSSTTAAVGTNTTQVATTAFVIAEKLRLLYRADDATITVISADNNKVFIATKASGTQTFTLPGAATAGLQYTFICGNAGGELKILGEMGNTIILKTAAGGTLLSVAADTGIKNTAATNIVGDTITLVSDGATSWYAVSQNGIFASN